MALTQEQILEARAKLGIPAEGYRAGGAGAPTSTGDRAAEFRARVAAKRAALAPKGPKEARLGEGLAGEFSGGVLGSLIKTGSTIEKGLDQTLGRGINIALGKGNVPTKTGEEARAFAEKVTDQSAASKTGEFVGTAAQYLAGPGGAAKTATQTGAKLLPKVGAFAARQAPEAAKDVAIGMANTGDVGEGLAQGALGFAGAGALGLAGKALNKIATRGDDVISYAKELTAPRLTPKEAEAAIAAGRVTEPGLLKKSKIIPSKKDELVAESVVDVVSPKNSLVENVDAIKEKISQTNLGVRNMIADRKIPFNRNQLRSRLDAASEENKLVFASEPTAERTYNAVVDEFMKHVEKGDTLGLFEARQNFDQVPAIKKLLESEKLGENVRKQIVLDVRRAANEYIAEQLPANNPYRAALMQESRMIDALGNIADQNARSIGMNKIEMLLKEYPVLKWIVGGTAAGLVGTGGIGIGLSSSEGSN